MARDRASRPEAKPLRLFVAVDIPDDVRDELARATKNIRGRLGSGRWVPPDNWHVTLKFLGSTWPRLLDRVHAVCARTAATHDAFEAKLSGIGAFPNTGRARVLWAGLEDPAGSLGSIAAALDRELAWAFEPEKRAFTPHLTFARFAPPASVQDALDAAELAGEPFVVDRLRLYRSHLQRPAPRYEVIGEFELEGR